METLATARLRYPPLITKHRPFIAVPTYNKIEPEFHHCMMGIVRNRDVFADECQSSYHGDSLITRSRNELTRQFLDSGCTHMFFIDSDLMFGAQHIKRILDHDEDIVGGAYPLKDQRRGKPAFVWNSHNDKREPDERGLIDACYVGTGFLCIKRVVFEKMISSGAAPKFRHDSVDRIDYHFWPDGVYTYGPQSKAIPHGWKEGMSRFLSEDWFFCQIAWDLGFKVWLDAMCVLRHVGRAIYPLDHQNEALGFTTEQVFRDAETGGGDSVAQSPATARTPALSPIGVEDD